MGCGASHRVDMAPVGVEAPATPKLDAKQFSAAPQASSEQIVDARFDIPLPKAGEPQHFKSARLIRELGPPNTEHADDWRCALWFARYFEATEVAQGVAPWMDEAIMERIKQKPPWANRATAQRWLVSALDLQAAGETRWKEPSFWLIANARMWPDGKNPRETHFVDLKTHANKALDELGVGYERDVFEARGLATTLGQIGAGLAGVHPRQDTHAGLTFDEASDGMYVFALRIAALALDGEFQAKAMAAFEASGGHSDRAPPAVKGYMRMRAKLHTDHEHAESPKPAENCDANRVAWTLPAESLPRAYDAAVGVFGQPIRVKNNYSGSFAALEVTKGYRALLANFVFDSGRTWGSHAPEIKAAKDVVRQDFEESLRRTGKADYQVRFQSEMVEHAAALFEQLAHEPAKLVVEIQFMADEYMAMRKKTHAWYKIARAENANAMMEDYIGALTDD